MKTIDMSKTFMDLISEAYGKPVRLTYRCSAYVCRDLEGRKAGYFDIQQLFGCCGVAVVSGLYGCKYGYGYKHGYEDGRMHALFDKLAQARAHEMGYTVLLCTERLTRTIRINAMKENGWEQLSQFNNRRTSNDVGVYSIDLKPTIPVGLITEQA